MVCKEQGPFESQVSTRAPECLSGLPVEERGSCSDRMVAQSKSDVSDISFLGQSTHRSVCHTSEQETSSSCISCSGTEGICHRCTESQLGRKVGIRISSFSSYSDMPQKNSDRGMFSMPGSSSLGRTSMVSSTLVSSGSSCNLSSMEGRSVVSTNIQDVASHPQVFRLHAWLLCNNACKRQAFLSQLPDESIPQKDLPPTICMITGGNLGWIGASDGKWIPSIRL